MKLEQCLAALKALPQGASDFEMPFRLISNFEQTEELLQATKNEFWQLLISKQIKRISVLVIAKMIVFPQEVKGLIEQFKETSIRDVTFIFDGQFAKQNIDFTRTAAIEISEAEPGQWTISLRNLESLKAKTTIAKLNVNQPLRYANVLLRPYFGVERDDLTKAAYEQRLVEFLTREQLTYVALRLNINSGGPLEEAEVRHFFALLAKAGCYKVDINFKNIPPQAEKLMTVIAHNMMIEKNSPWILRAIKRDHVQTFLERTQENWQNRKAPMTPQRKAYRASVKNGFFKQSNLRGGESVSSEPNLIQFFSTYFN